VLETGDPATSLAELLSWSHRQLSPPAAGMFAALGVHCGPDITVPAAASLAAEHRPGRFVLHDLVRGYAATQASQVLGAAGIREAIGRSLDHYLHSMAPCYDFSWTFTAAPPAPGVTPERPAGEQGMADWANAEQQVLLQATAQAAAAGLVTRAWQLFAYQAWFLGAQGYWADFRAAGQAVLAAAGAAGDQAALGFTHSLIGWYCSFTGAYDEDRAHQLQAVEYFRQAGDLPGQAWAHGFAAHACMRMGDWAEGVTHCGQAVELFSQAGDRASQGWALAGLGNGHAFLGNYELARGYARQALELGPEAGDPTSLALAWHALAVVHSQVGENRQAISCYRQAVPLARARKTLMARRWLATILAGLGAACRAAGDLPAAVQAWQEALQILDDLGLPDDLGIRARLERAGLAPPG